jgi:hypothetical protein
MCPSEAFQAAFSPQWKRRNRVSTKNQNAPKMLPWLARKAGIPLEVAEDLWDEASAEAARHWAVGSSEYCKSAIDSLLAKLASEALTRHGAPFGLGIWLRLPVRLWLAAINCSEAVALAATRRWPGTAC